MIAPEELRTWIVRDDERLFVVNKPGDVVCHPSKDGPWSSLSGAVRAFADAVQGGSFPTLEHSYS
jgi:23S rRNA pseudouridine1911/1915/1917 synthase